MSARIPATLRLAAAGTAVLLALALSACSSLGTGSSARAEKAKEMMAERCKRAGERILRTVDDVEGILLLKVRPKGTNFGDQFALTDPFGDDFGGDAYIGSFIKGFYRSENRAESSAWLFEGYRFVDAVDPIDGTRYRYTGRIEEPWQTNKSYLKGYTRFVLDRLPAPGAPPRYGVTYEDISTREEREYWIAGSSLRVLDLQSNEVIAERIGYMMDLGQGDTNAGRSPWQSAASFSCPSFQKPHAFFYLTWQTKRFVLKVLRPVGES